MAGGRIIAGAYPDCNYCPNQFTFAYPSARMFRFYTIALPRPRRDFACSAAHSRPAMPTPYQQALEAIYRYVDYSRTRQAPPYNADAYNLDRMRALCARLQNPQEGLQVVHIAGSKGKGSTAAMTAAILQAAGNHTGLYTSPHLHSFRERIRLDGQLIPQERLVELWEQVRPHAEALTHTTAFEIITALAFLYFQQEHVDWAVIEVGLGGRLDATNLVHPRVCAITPLSFEHTDLLGHTLSLIAAEKAGIIKPGAPVVSGPQQPEAMTVIARTAAQVGAPLWTADENLGDWRWTVCEATAEGLRLDIAGPDANLQGLWVDLAGRHQAVNAAVAVAMVHALRQEGAALADAAIREGLAQAYWPGRLERLSQQPLIVVDSAHNRHSAEQVHAALSLFPHKRLILLFGASADKDIQGMLEVLAPQASAIIVTRSYHPRAADPDVLADYAREITPATPVHITQSPHLALDLAASLAAPDDLILGAGSIFVIADLRSAWYDLHPEAFAPDDWVHFSEPIDGSFTPMR